MTRSLAAALLLAAGGAVGASEPIPPSDPAVGPHRLFGQPIGPDNLKQLGKWVGGLPEGNPTLSDLLGLMTRIRKAQPDAPLEVIAETLREQYPGLTHPQQFQAVQELLNTLQGMAGIPTEVGKLPQPAPDRPRRPGRRPDRNFGGDPPSTPTPKASPNDPAGPPNTVRPPAFPQPPMFPPPSAGPPLFPPGVPFDLPPQPGFDGSGAPPGSRRSMAELVRRQRQLQAVKEFWERTFGPLDDSPALRQLLADMFVGANGIDLETGEGLAGLLGDSEVDPKKAVPGWLEGMATELAKLDVGGLRNLDLNAVASEQIPGPTSRPTFSSGGGGEGNPAAVGLAVLGAAVAGYVGWRYARGRLVPGGPRPVQALGEWPVDPRAIADRDGLVRAFEYLSVSVCGDAARNWNHLAIAAVFSRLATAAGVSDSAGPLAHAYAVARYAPPDDPLPAVELAAAREHLCRLAGVAAP